MLIRHNFEIIPLDIRRIRQGLGLTQKLMGERIVRYLPQASNAVPGSRINEWEMRVRPIPDYIFVAYAQLLMEIWAKVRGGRSDNDQHDLDTKFASLMNPALAAALDLEKELRCHRDEDGYFLVIKAENVRVQIQRHLESLLRVDFGHGMPTRLDYRRDLTSRTAHE